MKGSQDINPNAQATLKKIKNTGYKLCDVNHEDTIRHNIALSTGKIYIPYPLGTIIK